MAPFMDNPLLDSMMALRDDSQVPQLSRFFRARPGQYGYGDQFLGIKVPVTRSVVGRLWNVVSIDQVELCLLSEYHEVRLAALLTLVRRYERAVSVDERHDLVRFYLAHTDYINNWDLVGLSCYKLLGDWLLDKDRSVLYEMARNSSHLWEQRIAIVSTLQFIRHGQNDDTFRIADMLLYHSHDLIQKAVGWMLREAGKRDKEALVAFLNLRYRTMPRTMLRYAIEKFPEEERQLFLRRD